MKKNMVARVLTVAVVVAAALSAMGCSTQKTVTKTNTVTDANGNKTTTTTTTTTENGKTTTTQTTETVTAEEVAEEEKKDLTVATLTFDNEAAFTFDELYFVNCEDEDWGINVLGDDTLEDKQGITFKDGFTYSDDYLSWDVLIVDDDGATLQFNNLDMSKADDPTNITILFEYNADDDTYSASVM